MIFDFFKRRRQANADPSPSAQPLTDADYGALFERLLVGVVDQGWGAAEILAVVGQGFDGAAWAAWVRRRDWAGLEGQRLARLVMGLQGVEGLGSVWRPLEVVVGRLVLADEEREIKTEVVGEGDADYWFEQGNSLYFQGKLEEAIAAYDRALEIKPDLHEAWSNKGSALDDLGKFEEAIAAYDRALDIKPDKHEAWLNKGVALKHLGKVEEAIAAYDRALEIKPDKHEAWYNKGVALVNLGKVEEAIAAYDRALEIKPDLYAAWSNKGSALDDLGKFEEAIAAYDRALEIKPDLHEAWLNKGVALNALGKVEEAIASYDRALEIKPDKHKVWSNRGVALNALGKHEEAIAACDRALEIKSNMHEVWFNRSIAVYGTAGYGRAFTNLQPNTILHLTKRGYEGSIETLQEGLKYCPKETQPLGWGMLMHYMGERHYRHGKRQPNPTSYNHQALDCYHQALQTLTPQDHPTEHLELLQDLVKVHLALGHPDPALKHQLAGLEVLKQLLNAAPSRPQKRRIEAQFHSFRQLTVDVLLQNQKPIEALTSAELNKNRCLAMLASEPVSPDYGQIQQLTNADTALIAWHLSPEQLTTFLVQAGAPEPQSWTQPVQPFLDWLKDWDAQYADYRAKDKQDPTEKRRQDHPWRTDMTERLTKLAEILQIPALAAELAERQHLILVPHRDLHRLPLHLLFEDEFCVPLTQPSPQGEGSGSLLPLGEGLGMRAELSPPAMMQRLFTLREQEAEPPVGHDRAEPGNEAVQATAGGWDFAYLPSIQTGLTLQAAPPPPLPAAPTLLSIENPRNDLPFAHIESVAINARFRNPTHLKPKTADRAQTLAALQQGHDLWHFTGHGFYNARRPEDSALLLKPPAPQPDPPTQAQPSDQLTAAAIRDLDLSAYHLVYLAACETALTGQSSIEDDYVGLVSALLHGRAHAVISTLWTVEEISSAWLAIRFYQLWLGDKLPIAQALHQAQTWLRSVTAAELATWLKPLLEIFDNPDDRSYYDEIKGKISNLESSSKIDISPPYAHPYYWAAFTLTGGITE